MARCKSGKCGCRTKIVSNVVSCINSDNCYDVCVNPICGTPNVLNLFAPVVYDEIGINLCTTFTPDVDITTEYPMAASASVQVVDISYTYGDGNVVIEQISGRPNCYSVTLSNLTVTLAVTLYDDCCRLLGTIYAPVVYLPSDTTATTYDEDTNPSSVELEIFAPYGVSYNLNAGAYTAALNNIGFLSADNSVKQGLNLYGIAKIIDFDQTAGTVTAGLTLVVQSLYFAGYKIATEGKVNTPKGSIISLENSDCMRFVAGDLLNLAIKPLDVGPPACEQTLKQDCTTDCKCDCNSQEVLNLT